MGLRCAQPASRSQRDQSDNPGSIAGVTCAVLGGQTVSVKVSIIVPAYNEEKLLGDTLHSIEAARVAFAALAWESDVVVCDNNSTDRTAEVARAAGAQVIFEPVNQISRARNSGARGATGDWIIFVDADSHPSRELFAAVATEIQRGETLAGGCTVKLAGHYPVASFITGAWNLLSRAKKWAAGSFIYCEAAAFREVGGFSEVIYAGEEIELFQRLKRLAKKQRRRITILHRTPLITSARKLHLYSAREHLGFLMKTVMMGGRTLKKREECLTWYDGRR